MLDRISEWGTNEGQTGAVQPTTYHSAQQHAFHNKASQQQQQQQQRLGYRKQQYQHQHHSHTSGAILQHRPQVSPSSSSSSHYFYAPASPSHLSGTMSHQQQPRQPPALNIAAAAAAAAAVVPLPPSFHSMSFPDQHHTTPYSAPANASSGFYNANAVGQNTATQQYSSLGHQASYNGQVLHPSHQSTNAIGGMHFTLPSSHVSHHPSLSHSTAYGNGAGQSHLSSFSQQQAPAQHGYRFGPTATADFASSGYHDMLPHQAGQAHSLSPLENGLLGGHDMNGHSMMHSKAKRKQVKNACVNCQKACKRCDEGRPCSRCVKYGLTASCADSARKERKRGIKRGPYKRRATTGSHPIQFGHHHTSNTLSRNGHHHVIASTSSSGGSNSLAPISAPITADGAFNATTSFASQVGVQHPSSSPLSLPVRSYFPSDATLSTTAFEHSSDNAQIGTASTQFASASHRSIQSSSIPSSTSLAYEQDSNDAATPSSATYVREAYSGSSMTSNQYPAPTMPPPGARMTARYDHDTSSSVGGHTFATSLYNNVPAVHSNGSRALNGQPGSAPAASSTFMASPTSHTALASSQGRSGTIAHLFSPLTASTTSSSTQASAMSTFNQGPIADSGGMPTRLYSDSSLATISNGSGATASTIHSPRTPSVTGAGTVGVHDVGLSGVQPPSSTSSPGILSKSIGGIAGSGGQTSSYLHHPRSSTLNALTPGSAGAFLNAQSGNPFPLHLPPSARLRGNASHAPSASASLFDGNRARSVDDHGEEQYAEQIASGSDNVLQKGLPAFANTSDGNAEKVEWPTTTLSSTNSRYQLPSPRVNTGEGRARPVYS